MPGKKFTLECSSAEALSLIGIASTLAGYRLIHHINKNLNVDFSKQEDLPYYLTEKNVLQLPLYHCVHTPTQNNWFMLSNSGQKQKRAIPALKNVDFFLIIDAAESDAAIKDLLSNIRKIKGVQMATAVSASSIKNMELLYADMELHLMEIQKAQKENSASWSRHVHPE